MLTGDSFLFLLANMVTTGMELRDTFEWLMRECSARNWGSYLVLCAQKSIAIETLVHTLAQFCISVHWIMGTSPIIIWFCLCVCARLDIHPFGFRRLSWWSAAWGVEVWCHQIDVMGLLPWSQDLGYPTNLKTCFKFWSLACPKLRTRIKCLPSFLVCRSM